jgi:hypothetical protein
MDKRESGFNQNNVRNVIIRWTAMFMLFSLCVFSALSIHQEQLKKLAVNSELLTQKSSLITQLHKDMLSVTKTQYQILHASNQQEVKQRLVTLSGQVSDYLTHYYQFEQISDSSDTLLLIQFKAGFSKWYQYNKELLSYANSVSDSGFINTLNMVDFAFSRLDTDEAFLIIAQQKQAVDDVKGISN